jgi:hypothetical protein
MKLAQIIQSAEKARTQRDALSETDRRALAIADKIVRQLEIELGVNSLWLKDIDKYDPKLAVNKSGKMLLFTKDAVYRFSVDVEIRIPPSGTEIVSLPMSLCRTRNNEWEFRYRAFETCLQSEPDDTDIYSVCSEVTSLLEREVVDLACLRP